jgi:hypothetical protein
MENLTIQLLFMEQSSENKQFRRLLFILPAIWPFRRGVGKSQFAGLIRPDNSSIQTHCNILRLLQNMFEACLLSLRLHYKYLISREIRIKLRKRAVLGSILSCAI